MIDNFGELIDRDRSLPGMARLLGDHRIGYLRYKPGTSLTVGLQRDGRLAFGYAADERAAVKLDKLVARAPAGTILEHDRQRRFVLALPAADRDLPGLRQPTIRASHGWAYKPQRRWVGPAMPDGAGRHGDRVVRCYRPNDLRHTIGRWPRPTEQIDVRIPRLLGHRERAGTLIIERLPGTRLDRLSGEAAVQGWIATGRALARWHRMPGPGGPIVDRRRALQCRALLPDTMEVAGLLAVLLPGSAARLRQLAARLVTVLDGASSGWCHGDFAADQVLIDPDDHRPALLDWDRSGIGPIAYDLASAEAAGTEAHDTGWNSSRIGLCPDHWRALLSGYAEIGEVPSDLDRFRALAWFNRAVDPFRRADPDWIDAVLARVQRAEELSR
jgi:hypothetical protein